MKSPLLLLALAFASLGACTPRDAAERLPPGSWLQAEAAPLDRLLAELEGLAGTPMALQATRVRERLRGCSEVFAHCGDDTGCSLLAGLRCQPRGKAAAAAREARGDDHWLLVAGPRRGSRVVARGTIADNGDVALRLRLPRRFGAGGGGLLMPAAGEAGAARLSDARALLHGRVRADGGLALASLVEAGGWGDRLFSLRNELFLGVTLSDRWELALYPPAPGQRMPPLALALDVRDRRRAVTAMEGFLAEVMAKWPVQRSDWQLGEHAGACLGNLRLMPELAPCYVATAEALVLGWNAGSVELALGSPPATDAGSSRVRLFLDRFPDADAQLRAAYQAPDAPPFPYPWALLEASGRRQGNRYLIEIALLEQL
jgi:hypothetical protein